MKRQGGASGFVNRLTVSRFLREVLIRKKRNRQHELFDSQRVHFAGWSQANVSTFDYKTAASTFLTAPGHVR